jgi:hypothetical protein
MTFSTALQRDINVPIEMTNRVDEAELDDAIAHLPNYPETTPEQVRAAAAAGDINARLVIERAEAGDPVAQDWL